MNPIPEFNEPAFYEFRVRGRFSSQSAAWFERMEVKVDETVEPVQTLITGHIEDQAALHGLISRIRDLGLALVSVNLIDRKDEDEHNGLFEE